MYQPENNSNYDSNLESEQNRDNIDANLSPKNVAMRKKQLEGIFTKLIIFGLAAGAILGVGAYFVINKLGLNKKPYEIEQEKREQQQKELEEQQTFFQPINNFPCIPTSGDLV